MEPNDEMMGNLVASMVADPLPEVTIEECLEAAFGFLTEARDQIEASRVKMSYLLDRDEATILAERQHVSRDVEKLAHACHVLSQIRMCQMLCALNAEETKRLGLKPNEPKEEDEPEEAHPGLP